MKKIGVVVVNYGDPGDTLELVQTFIASTSKNEFHLAVVDNASSLNNLDALLEGLDACPMYNNLGEYFEFSLGNIIVNTHNLGYSGGNNVGISFLVKNTSVSHIWLINNDTLLFGDSLEAALDSIEKYPEEIIGGSIIYYDSGKLQCAAGASFNELTLTGSYIFECTRSEDIRKLNINVVNAKLDYVHGACIIIPVRIIRKIGYLEEDYFLYYEEVDFCKRVLRVGGKLVWYPPLRILHKEGRAINGIGYSEGRSYVSEFHALKSSFIFAEKWYPGRFPLLVLIRLLGKILLNIRKQRFGLIKADLDAFASYIVSRIRTRKRVKAI